MWNHIIFLDFISWSYLIFLGWDKKDLFSWLFFFLILKESFLLFFIITNNNIIYYLLLISLSGLGPGILLSFGLTKEIYWKNTLFLYSIVSFLGKIGVFFLEIFVLIINYHTYSSITLFIYISFVSFSSFIFSLQNYYNFKVYYLDSFWLISWWTMDFFLFSLGNSGLTSIYYLIMILLTFYIINLENFLSNYLGTLYSYFWWGKLLLQIHIILYSVFIGIIYSNLNSNFIIKNRWISF